MIGGRCSRWIPDAGRGIEVPVSGCRIGHGLTAARLLIAGLVFEAVLLFDLGKLASGGIEGGEKLLAACGHRGTFGLLRVRGDVGGAERLEAVLHSIRDPHTIALKRALRLAWTVRR